MHVSEGDEVRVYEEDDWYHDGVVTSCEGDEVLVDFGDWVQQYPRDGFHEHWFFQRQSRFLVPKVEGETVEDYRRRRVSHG